MAVFTIDDNGWASLCIEALELRFQIPPDLAASEDLELLLGVDRLMASLRGAYPDLEPAEIVFAGEARPRFSGWLGAYDASEARPQRVTAPSRAPRGAAFFFVSIEDAPGQSIVRAAFELDAPPTWSSARAEPSPSASATSSRPLSATAR